MSFSPYSKQTWDTNSYVNPTRMNHIENGIKSNSDGVEQLNSDLNNRVLYGTVSDLNLENLSFSSNTRGIYYYPTTAANKPTSNNDGMIIVNYFSSSYIYEWAFVGNQKTEIYKRVKYNASTWSAWEKIPVVKTRDFTLTTNNEGWVSLQVSASSMCIVSATAANGGIILPFVANGNWYIKALNVTMQPIVGQINFTIHYTE